MADLPFMLPLEQDGLTCQLPPASIKRGSNYLAASIGVGHVAVNRCNG